MLTPPRWDTDRLEQDRRRAIERFRDERMRTPLEQYLRVFQGYESAVWNLLSQTADLAAVTELATEIVADPSLLEALSVVSAPPISRQDLKVLSGARHLSAAALKADQTLASRVVETVLEGLDPKRFPWVGERRKPTDSERQVAVVASAAILATLQVTAGRSIESRSRQEEEVENALRASGYQRISTRAVATPTDCPRPGEFFREAVLAGRRADFLIALWDDRLMPLECHVSAAAIGLHRQLRHDAADKAGEWTRAYSAQVVPAAVLSGIYRLRDLVRVQDAGVVLFWNHDLDELVNWIAHTRPS